MSRLHNTPKYNVVQTKRHIMQKHSNFSHLRGIIIREYGSGSEKMLNDKNQALELYSLLLGFYVVPYEMKRKTSTRMSREMLHLLNKDIS